MAKPPPRLYVADLQLIRGGTVRLNQDAAHYLSRVLRLGVGDSVLLFNEWHGEWQSHIQAVERGAVELVCVEQARPAKVETPDIALLFAPLKKSVMGYLIHKATELGVSSFVPVRTARTQRGLEQESRLRSISIEAAEQSNRLTVPAFEAEQPLTDIVDAMVGDGRIILFADEAASSAGHHYSESCQNDPRGVPPMMSFLTAMSHNAELEGKKWAILIGPEGGFSDDEKDRLRSMDSVNPIGLGPRILRAETAAIAAVSTLQSFLEGHLHQGA